MSFSLIKNHPSLTFKTDESGLNGVKTVGVLKGTSSPYKEKLETDRTEENR